MLRALLATLAATILADTACSAPVEKQQVLLSVAQAGDALVAVGERGVILRSDPQATRWEPVPSGTKATLTCITFLDTKHGYAGGHDATLLETIDGGATWKPLELAAPDTALFAIGSNPAGSVVAVGSFGAFWVQESSTAPFHPLTEIAGDSHFYSVESTPEGWLLAGERGTLIQLPPDVSHPKSVAPEGAASLHGLLRVGNATWLAFGIQGHLYRSSDDGASWGEVPTGTTGLLATGLKTKSGVTLLAGQARVLLESRDDGASWTLRESGITTSVAKLWELNDGTLLAFGEDGVSRLERP